MINSGQLARIVELCGTYLLHSTTFLLAVWGLLSTLSLVSRRNAASPERAEAIENGLNPLLVERSWKFAALLGLLTAPISLFADWSQPVWTWSAGKASSAIVVESHRDESVHSVIAVDEPNTPDLALDKRSPGDQPGLALEDLLDIAQSLNAPKSAFRTIGSSPSELSHPEIPDDRAHCREVTPKLTSEEMTESGTNGLDLASTRAPNSSAALYRQRWVDFAGWICLAWLMWSLFRLGSRRYALSRLLSRCEPLQGNIQTQLNRMTPPGKRIALVRFRALESDNRTLKAGPFACGLFRWTIVIPAWVEQELSPSEMQALLAHEMAHLIRRDPWWQLTGEILCDVLALQPMNWLARCRWQQATELLCDDWAVQHHATETSLASCLTHIAELRLPGRALLPGLAAVQDAGLLTQRIRWLLRPRRTEPSRYRHAGILTSALTLLFGTLVSTYGPHISLVQSAEIDSSGQSQQVLKEIESNLTETHHSLVLIKAQLPHDEEARSLVESLLSRTAKLKDRMKQRDDKQHPD